MPSRSGTTERPPRIKLAGAILVLLRMENGRQVTGKLHQISLSGGLLHLQQPLDEGIRVELIFHVDSTMRAKARTLFPMWATQGCLQPFQFTDLSEDERRQLETNLEKFTARSQSAATG